MKRAGRWLFFLILLPAMERSPVHSQSPKPVYAIVLGAWGGADHNPQWSAPEAFLEMLEKIRTQ